MIPLRNTSVRPALRAFTLIELIGVLAIIAIMASILAPNMLRSLDRAAVRAEYETMAQIGGQFERYVREQVRANPASPGSWLPTQANWAAAVATYSDLATADLVANKRRINRLFVYDTSATPAPRALLLSCMRTGLSLPGAASVSANFQTIWQTADDQIPAALGWAGWSAVAQSGDYLVVERINLRAVYLEEGRTFAVALNNTSSNAARYRINTGSLISVPAPGTTTVSALRPGDRVDLFVGSATTPSFSHVISSAGATFVFDGTQWRPN